MQRSFSTASARSLIHRMPPWSTPADDVLDGALDGTGTPRVHLLPPPTPEEVEVLVARIARRTRRVLEKAGALEPELEDDEDPDRRAMAKAVSERFGIRLVDDEGPRRPRLAAFFEGYSLHAGVQMAAHDREGLEKLCRYGARPPFAQDRLELLDDGRVMYRLNRPLPDGRAALVMKRTEFLRRLALLVPPKGQNLVRYHGVFASASKHREQVAALAVPSVHAAPPKPTPRTPAARRSFFEPGPQGPPPPRPRRLDWAALLERVFEVDVLHCEQCGGRLEVIAFLTERAVVRKVLEHLGLPTERPDRAPARAPPEQLDLGPSFDTLATDETWPDT